jgi:hypothetical protein
MSVKPMRGLRTWVGRGLDEPPPRIGWLSFFLAVVGLAIGLSGWFARATADRPDWAKVWVFGEELNLALYNNLAFPIIFMVALLGPLLLLFRAQNTISEQSGTIAEQSKQLVDSNAAAARLTADRERELKLRDDLTVQITSLCHSSTECFADSMLRIRQDPLIGEDAKKDRGDWKGRNSEFIALVLDQAVHIFELLHPEHKCEANIKLFLPPERPDQGWKFTTIARRTRNNARLDMDFDQHGNRKKHLLEDNEGLNQLFREGSPDWFVCNDVNAWESGRARATNTVDRVNRYNAGLLHLIKGKVDLPVDFEYRPVRRKGGVNVFGCICVDSMTIKFTDYDKLMIRRISQYLLPALVELIIIVKPRVDYDVARAPIQLRATE